MGTPELAKDVFEALILEGYNIVGIVSQPDRPTGRTRELTLTPTKRLGLAHNIPVYQPLKIKEDYHFLNGLNLDYILTLAYGQIVPQAVLDAPRFGAFNLHGSLLPALRGASPIRYSLIEGDAVTGMTLMKMTLAMDAGDMYAKDTLIIEEDDNYSSLLAKFSPFTVSFIKKQLPLLLENVLIPEVQDVSKVTFAPLIKKEHEHLSLALPSLQFLRWIKGLANEPGGYLIDQDKKVKLLKAKTYEQSIMYPVGTLSIEHDRLLLQCIDGLIEILTLQLEGKQPMDARSFINGYRHYHLRLLQ
jgi:methionyl-tRNA formyltransferase